MKRTRLLLVVLFAGFGLTGCPADMWIPVQTSPRPPVSFDHVQFLEQPPTREYVVIGIITPPSDEYDTEAELIKAVRHEAARHGADAIFVESQSEGSAWKFDSGFLGAKGGSVKTMSVRAKAIAWTGQP